MSLGTPGKTLVACQEYGDSGVLVTVTAEDYQTRWSVTQAVGQALRTQPPTGFVDVVASFETVFVSFDPVKTNYPTIASAIERAAGHPPVLPQPRRFEIPVLYGGEAGPDLDSVADVLGLTPTEVVALHTSHDWVVRFVGSPLGAPMMDGSRMPCSVSRLAAPRARVAPGSVGLSGFQSIVYNAASPGGWRLIGRTPAVLFDLSRAPYVVYRAGDTVAFRAIHEHDWDRLARPLRELCDPLDHPAGAQ